MRFMVLVFSSKGASIFDCNDRGTNKPIVLSKQEVAVLRVLGWTCSRSVLIQPSTCRHLA